jgi:site-specific DNA-methyltransferase (adenine-specific)
MPESVKDRCTKAHEYIFLLSKSKNYYFDHEAIKEEGVIPAGTKAAKGSAERQAEFGVNGRPPEYKIYDGMRQKRSVWTVTTKPYKGAHFATFPTDLIEPCILAGCPKDGMVLDPFGGSGTTGLVSNRLGRNATLIELNPEYINLAEDRIDPPEQRLDSNLFTFE